MNRLTNVVLVLTTITVLAGCATPAPQPSPSATSPSASATATPTPTAEALPLPSVEQILEALDTGPTGDQQPVVRYGALLVADRDEVFEDARVNPAVSTGFLRVSCTSDGETPVTLTVTSSAAEPFVYEAPCAPALETGIGIATTESGPFTYSAPYTIVMTSENPAAAGVGVVVP